MMARWRWTEIRLLVFPCLLVLAGMALAILARGQVVSVGALYLPLAFVGLVLATHLALSLMRFDGDQVLFPLAAILTALGLVMVHRLDPESLGVRQTAWATLGLGAMLGTALFLRDPRLLRRYKYTGAAVGLALVAATLVLGRDVGGSGIRLWLSVGPLQFQPSEILKVLLVVFCAGYLDEHREILGRGFYQIGRWRLPPIPYLMPLLVMWSLSLLLLVVQRDLGAALLFFGVFLAMLYVASARALYVWGAVVAFGVGAYACYRLIGVVQRRVSIWLDPWSQSSEAGYQVVQALIALASGGILGAGVGYGQPDYIPEVATDFILASVGEELGLLGTLGLVMVYLLLVHRAYRIAIRARGSFNQLLAAGLGTVLALQTIVILAGNLKVLPLTGITLPFVSYGGSSLLTNYIIVGLLLRISRPDPYSAEWIGALRRSL